MTGLGFSSLSEQIICYHSGIKMTPYEAMFGAPQQNGLLNSILTAADQEELEQKLSLNQSSLDQEERSDEIEVKN